jgi:hypothetical protein
MPYEYFPRVPLPRELPNATTCPRCKRKGVRSLWETDFDMDCADCRMKEHKAGQAIARAASEGGE